MLCFLKLKKIFNKMILISAMLFLSLSASAQNWKYVLTDEGSDFYMQLDNAEQSVNQKVWLKEVSKKLEYTKNGKKSYLYNGFSVMLMVFDCYDRKFNSEKIIYYNSVGKVVHSESFVEYGVIMYPWEKPVPGTIGDKFMFYVCGDGSFYK